MRILFLLTTVGCRVKAHHPTGFLSAVLKDGGHETDYVELDRIDPNLIDEAVLRFRPHVLAASTVMQQFKYVRAYINYVKKRFPHIMTIMGGTHPILKPSCIEEVEGLDAICISEGEMPLLHFVNSIETGQQRTDIPSIHSRVGNEIIQQPNTYAVTEEDMAGFPHQDRMIFPRFRNSDRSTPLGFDVRVLWGRGCPYACTYCSVPSIRKVFKEPLKASKTRWVRYPPVAKAIEELEFLRDRWIFDNYVIDDDVFTTRRDWVMEFAQKYPSHLKDKLRYEVNLRVESVDKEIMQALKDTGCKLLKFGLENGNYDVRRKILKRPISDEKIVQVFDWARQVGIPAHTFNIVGIPTETKETVWETVKLNRKIRPARVQVTVFFPYFGTPLGDETIAQGLLEKQQSDSYFSGKSSVKLENLTGRQVERYAKWFKFLVYYPYAPSLAWQQLKLNLLNTPLRLMNAGMRSLWNRGPLATAVKVAGAVRRGRLGTAALPVETLGSDGERPIPPEVQDLEDMTVEKAAREQYDIEDWDANKPRMDADL